MTSQLKKIKTSDGKELSIPIIGFGTFENTGRDAYPIVKEAINCGYRHFDCAFSYGNEEQVGKAIKEAIDAKTVRREDLFIVTKLWITYTRPDRVLKCLEKSLKKLGLSYVDLYLLHWPLGLEQQDGTPFPKDSNGLLIEDKSFDLCQTWKAMEELVTKGVTKSIGISNCNSKQVEQVLAASKIKPLVNEMEVHPYLTNTKLIEFCHSKGLLVTAYSPLGGQKDAIPGMRPKERKEAIKDPLVKKLADKYKKNAGQILIRFAIERGLLIIVKTSSKERLTQNMEVWDFQLTKEEVKQLEALNCGFRSCDFDVPDVPKFKTYPFGTDIEF